MASLKDRALKLLALKTLRKKSVTDAVAEQRMGICTGCDDLEKDSITCTLCGCYMEVKTTCEINFNPKKLRYEITHCPAGKWGDTETANIYRLLDGLEPL